MNANAMEPNGLVKCEMNKNLEFKPVAPAEVGLLTKTPNEEKKMDRDEEDNGNFYNKVFKSVALYFSFFGLGLCLAVIGPSLLDLKFQVGATLQQVTLVFTARSVGYVIGSMVGGACFDKFENQLLMAATLFGTSLTGFFVPWCDTLWLLIVVISAWGFCTGFMDTGGNVMIVFIWGKDNGPWMQALHFSFAFGATIAPLIAGPFLTDPAVVNATANPVTVYTTAQGFYSENTSTGIAYYNGTAPLPEVPGIPDDRKSVSRRHAELLEFEKLLGRMMKRGLDESGDVVGETSVLTVVNTTDGSEVYMQSSAPSSPTAMSPLQDENVSLSARDSSDETFNSSSDETEEPTDTGYGRLWIPYVIIALYNFLFGLPFVWLYLKGSRRVMIPKKTRSEQEAESDGVREDLKFKITLLLFLYFFIFAYVGHETVYGGFIYTFAIKSDLGFTVQTASYLNAVFWGSFAFARALGICCAMLLSPRSMLVLDLIGLCTASTLLAVFGDTVAAVLWGASILLGVSMATVFPSAIAWTERYIRLTGKSTAVFCVAASTSEMFLPWVLGYLFAAYSFMMLMYVTLALSVATVVVYVTMQILASCHGEKVDDLDSGQVDREEDETVEMMSPTTIA